MLTSIEGKSVLVTGASKGIGKGIARVFAKAGAKVLVVSRNGDEAAAAAEEMRAAGGTASGFSADVSELAGMEAAAAAADERHGGLDVLCANAGVFPSAKIEDMSVADWDGLMAINLRGAFVSVKACLPLLKRAEYGRIVLTSSITGPITGFPGWSHYGASKAGQLGFLRTAAMEVAKYGITVNAVMPGNIETEGLADLGEDYKASMAATIPLGKLGQVEDIGYAALFLASKEAGFVTGTTIIVDGGQIIPESMEALESA